MALITFSGVSVALSATVDPGADLVSLPVVPTVVPNGDLLSVSVGFNTNPPPTTGIVYPLYR